MSGDETKKLERPMQLLAPPIPASKRSPFRFLRPIVERLNGNGHPHPTQETPKGLRIARHERKNLSAYLSSVDIALDAYDDLFSEFDPSPFSSRALSGDFLKELTRRHTEKHCGQIEVVFSLPRAVRNKDRDTEALIKDRLKEYFKWQRHEIQEDLQKDTRLGLCYLGFGAVGIALSTILTAYAAEHALTTIKIIGEILLVPGWFGEFEGLEKIVESRVKMSKQREFLARFSNASYVFVSSEDVLEKMMAAKGIRPASKDPKTDAEDQPPAPIPPQ